MDDQQLLDNLLSRMESDELDFKQGQYHLSDAHGQSQFIKDILAMANTPRNHPAYILVGVREESGKAVEVVGITDHPDPSTLGSIIGGRVSPTPRFTYRHVHYGDVELGLIEIPEHQLEAYQSRVDIGVIRKGVVYVRRNASNVEADGDDLRRLYNSSAGSRQPDASLYRSGWEQLYRDCDGFDPRRLYIAVIDNDISSTLHDWSAMVSVNWNMIVDFDADTDTQGHYSMAESVLRERRALHLSALDQTLPFTNRSTVWVAASGLNSRPTTQPTVSWRDWNRTKAQQIEVVIGELARITEPTPTTLVIFGGERTHVTTVCEIFDRAFTDRAEYVIATPYPEEYSGVAERFDARQIAVPFGIVCDGLREISENVEPPSQVALPQLDGGSVALATDRSRWIEEQLEPLQTNIVGAGEQEEPHDDAFLKGSTISWPELESRVDAERDLTQAIQARVLRELEDRATRRVNFWHRPGAGATTVARRIAWNLRHQFPTVIALDIQPQETAERIRHVFGMTRLPVLVIIDLPHISQEVVDRFYDELRRSHVSAVLFNVQRRFENRPSQGSTYLDSVLSKRVCDKWFQAGWRRLSIRWIMAM